MNGVTEVAKKLYRIILADDEPMIRNGLAQNVPWRDLGFDLVGTCEDGQEVIDQTRSMPVDAILADIRMPTLSGIELAETVRREAPETIVLFLTAYSDFQYAQAAIEHCVWRYLVKPVNYAELLENLKELYQELARTRGEATQRSSDPIVSAVDDYVLCHYRNASLAHISRQLGLTPEHVSRVYYQQTGTHFSDRLKEVRMGEAARLLLNTRYRVGEISEIVGYANPKNFTRCFQRHFGTSPREYRLTT